MTTKAEIKIVKILIKTLAYMFFLVLISAIIFIHFDLNKPLYIIFGGVSIIFLIDMFILKKILNGEDPTKEINSTTKKSRE